MDYSEFNGLGLLGQSIKQIKEDNIQPVLLKYDDFLENRSTIDDELTQFIEKNKELLQLPAGGQSSAPLITPSPTTYEKQAQNINRS